MDNSEQCKDKYEQMNDNFDSTTMKLVLIMLIVSCLGASNHKHTCDRSEETVCQIWGMQANS
jgi:hypothetical protein